MLPANVDGDVYVFDRESVAFTLCEVLNKFVDGFSECVSHVMSSRRIVGRHEVLDSSLTINLLLNFLAKHGSQLFASLSKKRSRDSEIDIIRSNFEAIVTDAETIIRKHKNLTPYSKLPAEQKYPFVAAKHAPGHDRHSGRTFPDA